MKTTPVHQHLETPTVTDTQEHVYQKPVRDVNELKQHLIETWSATSRASLIKRLISGKIVLMRVSKSKANTEHLLYCLSVTVMTFKDCCSEQTDLWFVSQGRARTALTKGGQFCCSFDANLLQYLYAKNYCLSNAMHGQNINLPVCVCVCECVCVCVSVRHTFCQLTYRSDPSTDFYSW